MKILALSGLLLLPGIAVSAEAPGAFAYAMPLEVPAGSGLARLSLPASVYEGAAQDTLRDVRVFDGAGQSLPYAWLPAPAQTGTTRTEDLTLFPILARGLSPAQGARLRLKAQGAQVSVEIEQEPGSKIPPARVLRGYLIDLGRDAPALAALRVDWTDQSGAQVLPVAIERGDDLDHWQPVVAQVTLARLQAQGQELLRDTIDMADIRTRYLRITFPDLEPVPVLRGVQGQFRQGAVPVVRQWKEVTGRAAGAGVREYELAGAFPVDRVQVLLGDENAVLPLEIFSRRKDSDPWRSVSRATFYRLAQGQRVVSNAEIAVPTSRDRHWQLRVVAPAGALRDLTLRVGWVPEQLVFVTQGQPPYRLAYGHGGAADGALPIATVVPGYGSARAPAMAEASPGAQQVLAGPGARDKPMDTKLVLLWAALVAGVALLAWMAWSLGRQLKGGPDAK